MTFVILTGGIDLSVHLGTFQCLDSRNDGQRGVTFSRYFDWVTSGAILGALNGLLISKGKMAPFIATLATMTIYRGATLSVHQWKSITGLGDSFLFSFIGRGYLFRDSFSSRIDVSRVLSLFLLLHRTAFGRKPMPSVAMKRPLLLLG